MFRPALLLFSRLRNYSPTPPNLITRWDAIWRLKTVGLSAVLAVMYLAIACGGGGAGGIELDEGAVYMTGLESTNAHRGTGIVVHESEIASLPRWQQEMLADPGWNQPYIPPARETVIESPTTETLLRLTRERLESNMNVTPRGFAPAGKSASWVGSGAPPSVAQGEYDGVAPDAIPPFGCNSDGDNSNNGNALEDVIIAKPQPLTPASYVNSGISKPNHFCSGGNGNDMYSAVFQVFTDGLDALELCYNAGLINGPIGPGGVCPTEAFPVTDYMQRCFNRDIDALPFGNPTELYNILIAPSGDVVGPVASSRGSDAYYQPFYFGSVSNCYGGAWIVSIESETPGEQGYFTNPVYGLLLKRWRDMSPEDTPWASDFGMPVFGPFAYAGGTPSLSGKGQYYAWGMYFEGGFMWWVDYDNDGVGAAYPNATDEAQCYRYTGSDLYSGGGEFQKMPTVYYGGQGDLGVSVTVQGQRETDEHPWEPVVFTGTQYNIALGGLDGNIGFDTRTLSLLATGNGGVPDADCNYKYYIWSLRNGTIISAGAPFDPAQRFVTGEYGSDTENRESIYVVRVQVTDADNSIAYGDSFPIHLGDNGSTGGLVGGFPEVVIINNDLDDLWPTNLAAIHDDLDALQVDLPDLSYTTMDYYDGIGQDALDNDARMVLWYQGGPAAGSGEPFNTNPYTNEQAIALNSFRLNGIPLVHFTQSAGVWDNTNWTGTDEHSLQVDSHQFNSILSHTLPATGGWTTANFCEGILGIYAGDGGDPLFPSSNSPIHGVNATDGDWFIWSGPRQRILGEAYIDAGSCGASFSGAGYGWINPGLGQSVRCVSTGGLLQDPLDFPGAQRGMGDGAFTFKSWGNTASRSYTIGYAWADLYIFQGAPFLPTRAQTLQNIMASLDNNIFTDGGSGGWRFGDYDGDDPAIVRVQPIFWNDDGTYIEGTETVPGIGMYPDDTGIDVFRSTVGAFNDEILRTAGNGDEDGLNGNDIDMQAPFYGYWHYGLDGVTELGPDGTGVAADALDDVMWAGGVLVHNVDFNADTIEDWVLHSGDPDTFGVPPVRRLVSGYYVNNTGLNPAVPDGHVSAHYGFKPANLEFDGRSGSISFEAIARWAQTGAIPYGLEGHGNQPARLRWSLYPGHGVVVPVAGYPEYGKQLSWKQFLQDHDIANGGVGVFRNEPGFLRPSFSFGGHDSLTDGRIIDFDFRNIIGWQPDFNGNFTHGDQPNGTDDPGDKFPYRARLITGWTAYMDNTVNQTVWPNRMPDPTSFIELGGYMVDTSAGDPGVMIVDDVEQSDPVDTYEYYGYPDLKVDLFFEIVGGMAPYEVTLDPAYDLRTYDPRNPLATFDQVLGLDLTWTEVNAGMNSETVTWQDLEGGDRIFALKVRDSTGTNIDMFFYPDAVDVRDPGFVIVDDPDEPDPGEEGTYREIPPDYELDLHYIIVGGTAPYEIRLDPFYDLEAYDPLNPYGSFETVFSWTEENRGKNSHTVTFPGPIGSGGDRILALWAIDATGENQNLLFWPFTLIVGDPD